jgi:cellulose synthase/poly-beta-1,6-N-acetylglucosamine synthase-like glycosyltransferase
MWNLLLVLVFWGSLAGLLHTYLLYPLLMWWLARGKAPRGLRYSTGEEWPSLAILMAAYNEEAVIEEKMDRLLDLDYPQGKLQIWVGSDCSTDRTNAILSAFAKRHDFIQFIPYKTRQGKPGIINDLAKRAISGAAAECLIITDASVMPEPQTAKQLIGHFKDPEIGLVDGHIRHTGMRQAGISRAENSYISTEAQLKYWEGQNWGCMMGPFGGLYAIRAAYFSPVPDNYLVDDFYICMRVFEQGGKAISDLEAVSYESVSHEIQEEYRRKTRISAGNFQNLFTFTKLWWPPVGRLRFAFFSHKALRWLGPFLLLLALLSACALAWGGNLLYQLLFFLMAGGMLAVPILDRLLRWLNIHFLPLRGAHYFLAMNRALLSGFFKFAKGIRSNVWQPTKRN